MHPTAHDAQHAGPDASLDRPMGAGCRQWCMSHTHHTMLQRVGAVCGTATRVTAVRRHHRRRSTAGHVVPCMCTFCHGSVRVCAIGALCRHQPCRSPHIGAGHLAHTRCATQQHRACNPSDGDPPVAAPQPRSCARRHASACMAHATPRATAVAVPGSGVQVSDRPRDTSATVHTTAPADDLAL